VYVITNKFNCFTPFFTYLGHINKQINSDERTHAMTMCDDVYAINNVTTISTESHNCERNVDESSFCGKIIMY